MDYATIDRFRYSQLYSDIQEALQALLNRKMASDQVPPLTAPNEQYWIQGHPKTRYPGGCWCRSSGPQVCKPYSRCKRRPRPILGDKVHFYVCDRPHEYNRDCLDRVCFDPNTMAAQYLDRFVSERVYRRSSFFKSWKDRVSYHLDDYGLSRREFNAFSNIIHLILEDLQDVYADKDGVWDPQIHSVLKWHRMPMEYCIIALMREMDNLRLERADLSGDKTPRPSSPQPCLDDTCGLEDW
ncbi:hypothetical protein F66182_6206 [Fusarium sp. NRRL 66182]|nr:hypothetical protein F66182_6206 [Fusarium sp. NRRL 66182]